MPPIYQEFLDVFKQNPATAGFADQLLAAAQTPKGSAQRQALDDLLRNNPAYGKELVAAGVVSKPVGGKSFDPNWLNFFGWILNQMTATTPTGAGGGGAEPTVPTPGSTGGASGGPAVPIGPSMAVGGQVSHTGTATVHAGEGVFSVQAVPIFQKMVDGMNRFGDVILQWANKIGTGGTGVILKSSGGQENPLFGGLGNQPLNMHQTMYDLSKARVTMESALLDKHKQVIALDMQRIQAIQALSASGVGVQSLEGAFAKVYELRGRMGAGGFTKENL